MGLISQVLLQKDAFLRQKLNIFNRLGGGDDPDLLRNFGNVKVNFLVGGSHCVKRVWTPVEQLFWEIKISL